MTTRVPQAGSGLFARSGTYIAKPCTATLLRSGVDRIATLLGQQTPIAHENLLGATEAATGTYRFLMQTHPNHAGLYFSAIPIGALHPATSGTMNVPGAENTPITIYKSTEGFGDLSDATDTRLVFSKFGLVGNSFNEITYDVTTLRLHHVVVWEIPRLKLSGTDRHVDRSIADTKKFLTDNGAAGASNGRGWRAVLDSILDARIYMRRHLSAFTLSPPAGTSPGVNSVWTDLAGWTDLRAIGRNVKGSTTSNRMRVRVFVYVSAVTGGTWEFRVVGTDTSSASAGFTTTGWKPGTASLATGVEWNMVSNTLDDFKFQVQRTAGAGTLTVAGFSIIEEPVT